MSGQVVAVASGKGGVGKTTTVVNLGVVLRRADHSVALVDADLGMANLGAMLGVTAEHTLHDVLAERVTVEEAIIEEAPGFAVLAGSSTLTDYPSADPAALGDVLETLADAYDFVLVDTGAGMSHEDVLPLGLADLVVLVATPDPAAIGDTRKTAELADLAEGIIAGLVVTKAEADTDATHVARQVGVELIGVVPYDATVRRSTAAGQPLEAVDPETPAAAAYRELADALADGAADPLAGELATEEVSGEAPPSEGAGESVPAESPAADHESDGGEAADAEPAASAPEPTEADDVPPPTEPPDGDAETDDEGDVSAESADDDAPEDDLADDMGAAAGADEGGSDDDELGDGEADGDEGEAAEEDYLAEFEDDEPERSGGILARIGRLFR